MLLTGKYGASKRSTGLKIPNEYHPGALRHQWKNSKVVVKSEYQVDQEYPYPVKLEWENNPSMVHWNEVCAWTVEHMGLPGYKYRTEITPDYMIWNFINQQDQLIFILAWGNDQ